MHSTSWTATEMAHFDIHDHQKLSNWDIGSPGLTMTSQSRLQTPKARQLFADFDSTLNSRDIAALWPDVSLDELFNPRFITISNNNSFVQGAVTGLLIVGKLVATLLLLWLTVAAFFALGVLGNSSQVYNRYGHFDPYSPWAPYTANGAIDQPGYKGRALDTGEGGRDAPWTQVRGGRDVPWTQVRDGRDVPWTQVRGHRPARLQGTRPGHR